MKDAISVITLILCFYCWILLLSIAKHQNEPQKYKCPGCVSIPNQPIEMWCADNKPDTICEPAPK